MEALTVLVVPTNGQHIVAALADLSALGLVTPLCLTTADRVEGSVVCIEGGVRRHTQIENELAVRDPRLVRLVAISTWSDDGSEDVINSASRLLRHLPPSTIQIHLVLAPASGCDHPPPGGAGWRNIVISPEDGYRPDAWHEGWSDDSSAAKAGRRVAHSIAALAGLLKDHPTSWADEIAAPVTPMHRVARVYYRRLDGRGVEKSMHARLFDMSQGLPRIWHEGQHADHYATPGDATNAMAARWWGTARRDFTSPRVDLPIIEKKEIGLWAAIRLFFSFFLSALKNAPVAWANGAIARGKQRMVDQVGRHIFGTDSAFQVVLGERSPHDADRMTHALETLEERLPPPRDPVSSHEHAWKTLIDGALVLADAASGSSDMGFSGSQVQTVDKLDDIVPGSNQRYEIHSFSLKTKLRRTAVDPGDFLAMTELQDELKALAPDASSGSDAAIELEELMRWWGEQRKSYAGRTAEALGRAHRKALQEVRDLGRQLSMGDSIHDDVVAEIAAQQKRTRRVVLAWLTAGILLAVAFAVLGVAGIIAALIATGLGAAAVLGSLIGSFVSFYGNQRRLFHLLNQLDRNADLAPILKKNFAAAVADARAALDAYGVHGRWMRVLRLFLEDPFGLRETVPMQPFAVSGDFPLAAAVGVGSADPVLVAREVVTLEQKRFVQGWLHRLWRQYLDALPNHLGVDGVYLNKGDDILRRSNADARRTLDRVISQLTEHGAPESIGRDAWQEMIDDLGRAAAAGRELLPKVSMMGSDQVIDRSEFERRFTGDGASTPFRKELFDAQAVVEDLYAAEDIWVQRVEEGLSRSTVLVAHSRSMMPNRLQRIQAAQTTEPVEPRRSTQDDRY